MSGARAGCAVRRISRRGNDLVRQRRKARAGVRFLPRPALVGGTYRLHRIQFRERDRGLGSQSRPDGSIPRLAIEDFSAQGSNALEDLRQRAPGLDDKRREEITPFPAFSAPIPRVIYTTNASASLALPGEPSVAPGIGGRRQTSASSPQRPLRIAGAMAQPAPTPASRCATPGSPIAGRSPAGRPLPGGPARANPTPRPPRPRRSPRRPR